MGEPGITEHCSGEDDELGLGGVLPGSKADSVYRGQVPLLCGLKDVCPKEMPVARVYTNLQHKTYK